MTIPKNKLNSIDAFLPAEMAERAEEVGVKKANLPPLTLFFLAVLAGAFIAMGAIFSTAVTAGTEGYLPFGVVKLLGGLAFCLGLILVVVAGAELFTGNNLIVMAYASGKITTRQILQGWLIVYIGNFIGAVATASIVVCSQHYMYGKAAIGLNALSIATAKCQLSFLQGLMLGILCNALVCLAIWLTYSARSTTDKILAIIFPITAFVTAGFEHSVANMYFISVGLFIKSLAPPVFWETIGKTGDDYAALTWNNFLICNLIPVTLGNIFGGSILVGLIYWFIYLRKAPKQ